MDAEDLGEAAVAGKTMVARSEFDGKANARAETDGNRDAHGPVMTDLSHGV